MELEGTDWIHLAQYAIGVSGGLLCFYVTFGFHKKNCGRS
jgi:hypothetical protein